MTEQEGLTLDALIEHLQTIRKQCGGDVKVAVTHAPFGDGEQQLLTADQVQLLPTTSYSDYDIRDPEYVGIGPIVRCD